MNETDVTDYFDQGGREPGLYTLELETPPKQEPYVIGQWFDHFDAPIPGNYAARLASVERLVYAGSHGQSVYRRICQHARGEKSSTIMDVWPPVDIFDVEVCDDPKRREWGYASGLADESTAAWCDGELL